MFSGGFEQKFLQREQNRRAAQAADTAQPRSEGENIRDQINRIRRQSFPNPRQGPQQNVVQGQVVDPAPLTPNTIQYESTQDFIRSSMLPGVYDVVGESGVYGATNENTARQNREGRLELERRNEIVPVEQRPGMGRPTARDLSQATENLVLPRSAVRVSTEYPTGQLYKVRQEPIPGLNDALAESYATSNRQKAENVFRTMDRVLETYPELKPLVMDADQGIGRTARPIKGSEFAPYMQYTDVDQFYSDPELRGALYRDILAQPITPETADRVRGMQMGFEGAGDGQIDSRSIGNLLDLAEENYTSGDATRQAFARNLLDTVGGRERLASIEQPAFQNRRPIIGGGGYVKADEDPDARYINDRAKSFNDALDLAQKQYLMPSMIDRYPGLGNRQNERGVQAVPTQRSFKVDSDGSVITQDGSVYGDGLDDYYRYSVSRGYPRAELQDTSSLGSSDVSKNVLRFLRDFPALTESGLSFQAGSPDEGLGHNYVELPPELVRPVGSFLNEAAFSNRRGGDLLYNSPMDNSDIIMEKERLGLDADTSSYLRQVEDFGERGGNAPNFRGRAYAAQGFGPYGTGQYAYVTPDSQVVPLQPFPPERPLVGEVDIRSFGTNSPPEVGTTPAATYKSQPRFYSSFLPGVNPEGVRFAADRIKAVPSSLLPGVSDLIPSAEAIRQTYNVGPMAGASQAAKDFLAGAPISLGLAPILSAPAVAPLAPGIGAGFITTAGGEAVNELVKQETGKSAAQRLQETAGAISGDTSLVGTPNRSFARDSNQGRAKVAREADRVMNPPTIQAATIRPDNTGVARPDENFFQRRLRLAEQARQRDPGDFGFTELLFGR